MRNPDDEVRSLRPSDQTTYHRLTRGLWLFYAVVILSVVCEIVIDRASSHVSARMTSTVSVVH